LKSSLLKLFGVVSRQPVLQKLIFKLIENYQISSRTLKRRKGFPFQILIYHRVLPEADDFAIDAVTTEEFRQQIELLASYFRVVSLKQLLDELDREALQPYTICITFDDGYQDNFRYAFPILQEYEVPATIFLPTDFIGTNKILWHDVVLNAFKNTKVTQLSFEKATIMNRSLSNTLERKRTAFQLLEWLKKCRPALRDEYIDELLNLCNIMDPCQERLMLNWDEVRTMFNSGISFGAHTKSHPILSTLEDVENIEEEIVGSKRIIEKALACPTDFFAYPNGKKEDFDDRSKQIIDNSGFRCAVTTYCGTNSIFQDKYELSRGKPWYQAMNQFFALLLWMRFR